MSTMMSKGRGPTVAVDGQKTMYDPWKHVFLSASRRQRLIVNIATTAMNSTNATERGCGSPIRLDEVHNALSSPCQSKLRVSYITHPTTANRMTATESDVDAWELRASRRALANIKTLL